MISGDPADVHALVIRKTGIGPCCFVAISGRFKADHRGARENVSGAREKVAGDLLIGRGQRVTTPERNPWRMPSPSNVFFALSRTYWRASGKKLKLTVVPVMEIDVIEEFDLAAR
jgi:hypothetical protein